LRGLFIEIFNHDSNLCYLGHEIVPEGLVIEEAILVILNPEFCCLCHRVTIE
jgi:hypothetical protein